MTTELEALRAALGEIPDPARTPPIVIVAALEARLAATRASLWLEDLETARRSVADALALARSAVLPGKTSAWVGEGSLILARIEAAAGRPDQARQQLAEAEAQLADTLPSGHPLRLEAQALANKLSEPQAPPR